MMVECGLRVVWCGSIAVGWLTQGANSRPSDSFGTCSSQTTVCCPFMRIWLDYSIFTQNSHVTVLMCINISCVWRSKRDQAMMTSSISIKTLMYPSWWTNMFTSHGFPITQDRKRFWILMCSTDSKLGPGSALGDPVSRPFVSSCCEWKSKKTDSFSVCVCVFLWACAWHFSAVFACAYLWTFVNITQYNNCCVMKCLFIYNTPRSLVAVPHPNTETYDTLKATLFEHELQREPL